MLLRLFFLLVIIPSGCYSQYDSTYAVRFPNHLGVAIFQCKPVYMINITRRNTADTTVSNLTYQTLANFITGVGLHYRDVSFFIGFGTPGETEQQVRKGKTKTSQLNLAFTRMRVRLEASARIFRGFYENNSPAYLPDFSDTSQYYQDPEMKATSIRFKGFYFLNNKNRFSYGAAYIHNVRQLKSAGSVIFSSNLYTYRINSSKYIVPEYIRSHYSGYQNLSQFDATSFSLGTGYTHTFVVFKRVFINLLFTLGAEVRHVKLKGIEGNYDTWQSTLSAYDLRSSIGYQSDRFFLSFQSIVDGNNYLTPDLQIDNLYLCGIFMIGYRFGLKSNETEKE